MVCRRNFGDKYGLVDRALSLVAGYMEVTRCIVAAEEDLAKNPTDEDTLCVLQAFKITLAVLAVWGAELTDAFDKEYGRPTDEHHREVSEMLHQWFVVPVVN